MIAALLIGLMGSVHCVGMCAPLVLTITRGQGWWAQVAYHSGRMLVYVAVGVLFGILRTAIWFPVQQYASLILGLVLLTWFGIPRVRLVFERWYSRSRLYTAVRSYLLRMGNGALRPLVMGMLNGILPCGLVYVAATGALLGTGMYEAVLFMLFFGLGTLPVLVVVSVFAGRLSHMRPGILPRLTTVLGVLGGLVLLMRGMVIQSPDLDELLWGQMHAAISMCIGL